MTDFVAVTVVDGLHDLAEDDSPSFLREVPFLDDPIKQLAALAELHDEVHISPVLKYLKELDDVGMVLMRMRRSKKQQ